MSFTQPDFHPVCFNATCVYDQKPVHCISKTFGTFLLLVKVSDCLSFLVTVRFLCHPTRLSLCGTAHGNHLSNKWQTDQHFSTVLGGKKLQNNKCHFVHSVINVYQDCLIDSDVYIAGKPCLYVCFKAEGPCKKNHQLMWVTKDGPRFLKLRFQCIHVQFINCIYSCVCIIFSTCTG